MRYCLLLACSALIAITASASSLASNGVAATLENGDLSAFTAANSIPGPLSITAATLARVHVDLLPSLATAHIVHLPVALARAAAHTTAGTFVTLPDELSLSSLMDQLPIGERMRRMSRTHLNTSDGSLMDDFAICYRINQRWGFQVIPGDPAPVKLPMSSTEDAEGITVGMVVRLSR